MHIFTDQHLKSTDGMQERILYENPYKTLTKNIKKENTFNGKINRQ